MTTRPTSPREPQRPRKDGPRSNDEITDDQVRLIDAKGENLGVVSISRARDEADASSLDLVEIAQGVSPPVVRVMDFGKYKYELQKKRHQARRHQKNIDIKEIKLRPNIEQHDFDVKMRSARRFLEAGDKVKFTLRFRGREVTHKELGDALLERVVEGLADLSKIESPVATEGRQLIMVLTTK